MRMRKVLLSSFFLFLISIAGSAQCDPAFSVSIDDYVVTFTPATSGPGISHQWRLGDGNYFHSSGSFQHLYVQSGNYLIAHVVIDSANQCRDSSFLVINVTSAGCNPEFVPLKDSVLYNTYHFSAPPQNQEVSWTLYTWYIDGVEVSSSAAYTTILTDGHHSVCLQLSNNLGCQSFYCTTVNVSPPPCDVSADFTYQVIPGNPKMVHFQAVDSDPDILHQWYFTNLNTADIPNPVFQYYQPGNYGVYHVVSRYGTNCRDSIVKFIEVPATAVDSCTADISVLAVPGHLEQRQLLVSSNQAIVNQQWVIYKFGDSSGSYSLPGPDPVITVADSGIYKFCVAITTSTGCYKFYCDSSIIITASGRSSGQDVMSYPNPAINSVRLPLEMQQAAMVTIKIYNGNGTLVQMSRKSALAGINIIDLPVQHLQRGQYFIEIDFNEKIKRSRFHKL